MDLFSVSEHIFLNPEFFKLPFYFLIAVLLKSNLKSDYQTY